MNNPPQEKKTPTGRPPFPSEPREDVPNLADDKKLNRLLQTLITEVRSYAEDQISRIQKSAEIGRALSLESDLDRLLEMIVDEARAMTRADAGTLYLVDEEGRHLCFKIIQNDTMNTRIGGSGRSTLALADVPLYNDGKPNHANVSSYSALTRKIVNIPDVYRADGFDFTGPKKYDATTGYRSRSMLVIPLKNHQEKVIGVLQLLNAVHPETGEIIPFSREYEELVAALASQATVALTNSRLVTDLKSAVHTIQKLFDAFIKSIAAAIDQKSPYTGGHIRRVVTLTMMIAGAVNDAREGPLKEVRFSQEEMEELRLAAWLHDLGKVTTPEYIIDKGSRLEAIFDRIELIETRFRYIAKTIEARYLRRKVEALSRRTAGAAPDFNGMDKKQEQELADLDRDLELIRVCNFARHPLGEAEIERLKEIGRKRYPANGARHPFLTEEELKNLTVPSGTLTEEERRTIQNHAAMTSQILSQLPFPNHLGRVPEFASSHHEKLDGSGYPLALSGEEIPLQARIMAIADIFEALTAKDRPYKTPMALSQAVGILNTMKEKGQIDPDVYEVFVRNRVHHEYARTELTLEQMDG